MKPPHMHYDGPQHNEPQQQQGNPQRRPSNLPRIMTYVCLLGLGGAQLGFVYHTLSVFTEGDPVGGLFLLAFGCTMSVIEMFMLALADVAAHTGHKKRAFVWRTLFLPVFLLNLVADFGAIATTTAHDQTHREQAVLEYEQKQQQVARADAAIERLEASIQDPQLRQPSEALEKLRAGRLERRRQFEANGQTPPPELDNRIVRLDATLTTTREIERQAKLRSDAADWLAQQPERPRAHHPQFEAYAEFLKGLGIPATPEGMRIAQAFGLVLIAKLVLVAGFWMVSGLSGGGSVPRPWKGWKWWPFRAPKTVLPEIQHRYGGTSGLPKVDRPGSKPPKQSPRRTDRQGPFRDDDLDKEIDDFDPDDPDDPDDKKGGRGGGGWLH